MVEKYGYEIEVSSQKAPRMNDGEIEKLSIEIKIDEENTYLNQNPIGEFEFLATKSGFEFHAFHSESVVTRRKELAAIAFGCDYVSEHYGSVKKIGLEL